jgi:predicted PurR-regulated permease PerM
MGFLFTEFFIILSLFCVNSQKLKKNKTMETTYFVLGVLSVIALIFIGIIAWGMFKISKQQTEIGNLKEDIQGLVRTISQEIEDTTRRIDSERQYIQSEIREYNDRLERQLTDIWRNTEYSIKESNSYTDKRIDKLIDTYFDIKKNKDLLKG